MYKLCSGFFLWWVKNITTYTLGPLVTNYCSKCFLLLVTQCFCSLIRAVMATSRLIYRVFAVLAVLDVVTLAYVQGRQAAFRTPKFLNAKNVAVIYIETSLYYFMHWNIKHFQSLIYSTGFKVNVYIRQAAVSLTREQKSPASLILVMVTLEYSVTTVIRLTPYYDKLYYHERKLSPYFSPLIRSTLCIIIAPKFWWPLDFFQYLLIYLLLVWLTWFHCTCKINNAGMFCCSQ